MHKQAFYSIAKSIAVLTVNNQAEGQLVIRQFISNIKVHLKFCNIIIRKVHEWLFLTKKDPKSSDSMRLLALLCLGETGKYMLVE
jgi:hypothetical protein